MSGIVGLLRRDGPDVASGELDAALATLAPRGPDGLRSWRRGPVALGCAQHRSTMASLHETLPVEDSESHLVVVHDARIDNRVELAARLDLRGRPVGELGDGELILAAWRRWGERCAEHLVGDYVFAVWDERERRLLVARDPIGARVVYYAATSQQVAFASEIKALVALPGVARTLSPERVAEFMAGFAPDRDATFLAGVRKVAAGTALLASTGGLRTLRHHELALPERVHRGTPDDVAAGFREVVSAAVRDRVAAPRGVAAMLSGGLDSSAIVSLARAPLHEAGGLPLPVYSFTFPHTPACDETPFIAAVAARGGLEPHALDCDALSPLGRVDELLAAIDQPFNGAHTGYRLEIARLVSERGRSVIVEGNGGDAVASNGLYLLAELARRGRFLRLVRELRALKRRQGLAPRATLLRYVVLPNVPAFALRLRRAVVGDRARFPAPPFVTVELAERTRLRERFAAHWHRRLPPRTEREQHLREVIETLPGNTYELTYGHFAVEPRFPFLDLRVIEYCLAVPAGHKLENGITRMLPRRAFAGLLPAEVTARTGKANPAASLVRRFFTADRALVEEELAPERSSYLDMTALRAMYTRVSAWSHGHPGEPPPVPVYLAFDQLRRAVVLARWLRTTGIAE